MPPTRPYQHIDTLKAAWPYHVTNPPTFFQGDDVWTVPAVTGSEQSLPLEAYYVFMRMPGEDKEEFLLLQPLVPACRPNMISWVAARMDEPHYGDVRVYRFPAATTVLGPTQVEALIDQDPQISAQITLWNQSGSQVIRGNLIVVPIQDSLVYLQPVYLQSTSSAFPEFQRIVVATPQKVVWALTLRAALELQFAGPGPGPSPTPSPTGSGGHRSFHRGPPQALGSDRDPKRQLEHNDRKPKAPRELADQRRCDRRGEDDEQRGSVQ